MDYEVTAAPVNSMSSRVSQNDFVSLSVGMAYNILVDVLSLYQEILSGLLHHVSSCVCSR